MSEEERTPPQKIRVTKLQEAQVLDLAAIEARCAAMFYEAGLSDAEVQPRSDIDIARLTRDHDVMVAEADHQPAGYLAWADEAPGVAWLPILMVAPVFQRFGIATRLLRDLGERAHGLGIEAVVAPCWTAAPWAMQFLGVRGFQMVETTSSLPEKLAEWVGRRGGDAVQPGQKLWWSKTDGLGTIPGLPRPV